MWMATAAEPNGSHRKIITAQLIARIKVEVSAICVRWKRRKNWKYWGIHCGCRSANVRVEFSNAIISPAEITMWNVCSDADEITGNNVNMIALTPHSNTVHSVRRLSVRFFFWEIERRKNFYCWNYYHYFTLIVCSCRGRDFLLFCFKWNAHVRSHLFVLPFQ